jgi:hypothetical protein
MNNKKLYLIRRQDVFEAMTKKELNNNCFFSVGALWAEVFLTDEEKTKYSFPIYPILFV